MPAGSLSRALRLSLTGRLAACPHQYPAARLSAGLAACLNGCPTLRLTVYLMAHLPVHPTAASNASVPEAPRAGLIESPNEHRSAHLRFGLTGYPASHPPSDQIASPSEHPPVCPCVDLLVRSHVVMSRRNLNHCAVNRLPVSLGGTCLAAVQHSHLRQPAAVRKALSQFRAGLGIGCSMTDYNESGLKCSIASITNDPPALTCFAQFILV